MPMNDYSFIRLYGQANTSPTKQKFQHHRKAMRPSKLVVPGAFVFVVAKIAPATPSFADEHAAQQTRVTCGHTRRLRLGGSDVEPDARTWQYARAADPMQDRAIVPP